MKINIRIAKTEDIDQIFEIGKATLPIYYYHEALSSFIKSSNYLIIVSEHATNIVGFLIMKISKKNIHIMSLGITKKYRKKGIGSKMLEYLEQIAKHYSLIKTVTLNVHIENTAAINFYLKHNFVKTKEMSNYYSAIPYNCSLNGYLMTKNL